MRTPQERGGAAATLLLIQEPNRVPHPADPYILLPSTPLVQETPPRDGSLTPPRERTPSDGSLAPPQLQHKGRATHSKTGK